MGHVVDIKDIVSRFRDRGEVDTDYVSATVATQWANDSIRSFLNRIMSGPDRHRLAAISPVTSVISGRDLYPLPADFTELHRVEVQESGTDWRPLFPVGLSERSNLNLNFPDKLSSGYFLVSNQIGLAPVPTWSGSLRLWYTPPPPVLINTDISGSDAGLFLHSEELARSSWTKTNTVIKPAQGVGPGGVLNLDALITSDSTTSGVHGVSRASTITAVVWTASGYVRAGARSIFYLEDDTLANGWAFFNLSTGAVGNKGASVLASQIELIDTGLYRVAIRFTGTAASHTFKAYFAATDTNGADPTFTGDGSTVEGYLGCLQLDAEPFPKPYKKVTTDFDTIFGWDEWVHLDMLCKFAVKEEGDVGPVAALRDAEMQTILSRAKHRDSAGPARVRNTRAERRFARFPYGRQT